ncbi:predicted protein [Streptomyces sp. SPB78]|uniref:hypothetical protein n=1 Tax=Streptomyces sp. (strain SPB78) TaxID=591157 RepID=UPI0001B56995|nr:hypothetical protein [Streptomyces sp. SPB78]EFL01605.1 predicted protein [Streptomyces sp. SPB78]
MSLFSRRSDAETAATRYAGRESATGRAARKAAEKSAARSHRARRDPSRFKAATAWEDQDRARESAPRRRGFFG